jgi:outer membrane lipopolysaccharide assembly protein LptE/RlpB
VVRVREVDRGGRGGGSASWLGCSLPSLELSTRRALGAALLLAASGCGYGLVGTSSNLAPHLETLYVVPFINQSGRAELDQRMIEAITQEWVRRARFQLVTSAEAADAVLTGKIIAVISTPVRFDEAGRANEYQLTVAADVQLVDRTTPEPTAVWQDPRFTRSVSYQVNVDAADYFDREVEAMTELSRDFARALVATILEGF